MRLEIFVVIEVAIALAEPESRRIRELERGHKQSLRIGERTKNPFTGAGVNGQAVRIVDLGPEVLSRWALVFAEIEHAGQRRETKLRHVFAKKQPGPDIDQRVDAGAQDELVGAARAGRIEQRVDRKRLGAWGGPLDPELDEARKFLAFGVGGVDRKPARRGAVELTHAQRAKVACPQKGEDLVLVAGGVDRVMHAESRKAGPAHCRGVELVGPVIEKAGLEFDVANAGLIDLVDAHRLIEVEADMIEGDLEGQS